MAPRIVSWSDQKIQTSPALSRASSIVSFDSTFSFSDTYPTYPSHSQISPTASEASVLPSTQFGAEHTGLPEISEEGRTPGGGHAIDDDSFIRHDTYFFKDGNVTFLIDGTLFCIHRYFFSRDSVYFSTRFAKLGIRDHEALPTIISISDVERNDFEALLSVLYPSNFKTHELAYEQWKSVLHLSTRWNFASLRELALKSITPPTPHDQLVLARAYSVDQWVLPALTALCSRTLPLGLDEARQMSMEDVILVTTVREEIRGRAIRADVFDISHHVEKAQAGKLNPPVGSKVYGDKLKCGITGRGSDLKVSSGVDPNVETEDIQPMGVTSPSGLQPSAAKEGDTDESHAGHSSKEVPMESPGVNGTSRDCLKKSVATPAVQTTGARKFEDTSRGAAEWPIARAVAENHAVTAMEGQEAKAKADAEARARAGVEAKVKAYAEARARAEAADAEAKARAEEEAKAKADAEVEARAYAEARARAEVAEADAKAKANAEAEAKAKANAEAKAHAIARVRAEAEAKAKADAVAEAKAKANAEAKARSKARAKAEAEAKAKEAKARAEAEAKARAETEAKARIEAEAKTKADAEAKAKVDAEARAKAYAEARARAEADAKARAEEEAKAKADAEAKAKAYAEARARAEAAEAEAKARAEEEAKAKAEVDAAAAKAELGAKKADKERLEIEARDKAEAARGEYEWCTQ